MMLKLMLELEFTTSPGGWVVVGGWVLDFMRLMLSQLQLKLELKFKLSLAKFNSPSLSNFRKWTSCIPFVSSSSAVKVWFLFFVCLLSGGAQPT